MNSIKLFGMFMAVVLSFGLLIAAAINNDIDSRKDLVACEAKKGIRIKSESGYVCVKMEVIK